MSSGELTKEIILKALQELSNELCGRGAKGELCLFGGTVMVLAFSARPSTKDVDGIFQPAQTIRQLAEKIGRDNGLPEGWLNDGVKGFVSSRHDVIRGNLPQFPHLMLTMPTPSTAGHEMHGIPRWRRRGRLGDVRDIIFLIRHLKLKRPEDVMNLVAEYYPPNQMPAKAQYLVQSLFEEGRI